MMLDQEKRANLYKQELINTISDLSDLQNHIYEHSSAQLIEQQAADEIISKINFMINEINNVFHKIERNT
jgi:hypothetical protein